VERSARLTLSHWLGFGVGALQPPEPGQKQEFPRACLDRKATLGGMATDRRARGLRSAAQQWEEADAVLGGGVRKFGADEIGSRGEEVELLDQRVARGAGFDGSAPARDEGHTVTALEEIGSVDRDSRCSDRG